MAFKLTPNTAWVETDGTFGIGDVITFHEDDLTPAQWTTLVELRENDRLAYVYAIMAGEPLAQWEDK